MTNEDKHTIHEFYSCMLKDLDNLKFGFDDDISDELFSVVVKDLEELIERYK